MQAVVHAGIQPELRALRIARRLKAANAAGGFGASVLQLKEMTGCVVTDYRDTQGHDCVVMIGERATPPMNVQHVLLSAELIHH